jgi:hypothetical protein
MAMGATVFQIRSELVFPRVLEADHTIAGDTCQAAEAVTGPYWAAGA